MRKSLFAFLTLFVTACSNPGTSQKIKVKNKQDDPAPVAIDTSMMVFAPSPPQQTEMIPDTVRVGGDFNGDGKADTAYGVVFGREYMVRFSTNTIRPMNAGKGAIRLINEGDLNADGRDELSIYQAPEHGCTYTMSTWSYHKGSWHQITDSWRVPTGCNYVSDEDLQNRIVLEDGVVYYYQEDVNDDNFSLVKRELAVK